MKYQVEYTDKEGQPRKIVVDAESEAEAEQVAKEELEDDILKLIYVREL